MVLDHREGLGLSQREFAKESGISRTILSKVEQGALYPGGKVRRKLASAMDRISGGSALTPSIGRRTLATALAAQGAGPGTKNTEKHPRGPPERSGGLVLAADASRMALENTATGTSSESVRDLTDRRRRPVAEWQGAHQLGR